MHIKLLELLVLNLSILSLGVIKDNVRTITTTTGRRRRGGGRGHDDDPPGAALVEVRYRTSNNNAASEGHGLILSPTPTSIISQGGR